MVTRVECLSATAKLNIRADLPGSLKDDINVDITDNALVNPRPRQQETEENEEGYYRSGKSYGSFYRQIPLPSVSTGGYQRDFPHGVLEITMPGARRQPQSRRIEIGEGLQPTNNSPQVKTKRPGHKPHRNVKLATKA